MTPSAFDTHPPLHVFEFLKMVAAGASPRPRHIVCGQSRQGVQSARCVFTCVVGTAFFGCLVPPLTFSIARKLGASDGPAFLAGCFIVFDMMNVIESRHVLVDSPLMFYCALSLWLALKYWQRRDEVW